jgi:electron transfer flavoprotein beta subunit
MAARTKPLAVVEASQNKEGANFKTFELPAPKAGVKLVSADNPSELIDLLHNEAKVI